MFYSLIGPMKQITPAQTQVQHSAFQTGSTEYERESERDRENGHSDIKERNGEKETDNVCARERNTLSLLFCT